jgi:hypothetical protein
MKKDATKTAFYAAVGAPVVATRKLTDTLTELSNKVAGDFRKEYGVWAAEGEKVVGRIADQKLVEDFTSRVDVDNISEQVGKLRGQLEDLVATWRQNFNPEKPVEATKAVKVEIDEAAESATTKLQDGAEKSERSVKKATSEALETVEKAAKAASGTTTRKPAARKPAAAKTTTKTDTKSGTSSAA